MVHCTYQMGTEMVHCTLGVGIEKTTYNVTGLDILMLHYVYIECAQGVNTT